MGSLNVELRVLYSALVTELLKGSYQKTIIVLLHLLAACKSLMLVYSRKQQSQQKSAATNILHKQVLCN